MDIVELEFADERDLLRGVKREAIFWKGVFIPRAL
jgi:hypothetical protein